MTSSSGPEYHHHYHYHQQQRRILFGHAPPRTNLKRQRCHLEWYFGCILSIGIVLQIIPSIWTSQYVGMATTSSTIDSFVRIQNNNNSAHSKTTIVPQERMQKEHKPYSKNYNTSLTNRNTHNNSSSWNPRSTTSVAYQPQPVQRLDNNNSNSNNSNKHSNGTNPKQQQRLSYGPVFYNVYIPSNHPNDDDDNDNTNENHNSKKKDKQQNPRLRSTSTDDVLGIIQEQLLQRSLSCPNSTWYYTLITNTTSSSPAVNTTDNDDITLVKQVQAVFDTWCGSTFCHRHAYVPKGGDEVYTLQTMWDYCQHSNHSNQIVTYIHDKGSFHNTEANERSRQIGTKAALDCRRQMMWNPKRCTICTSEFNVLPQYLGNSNMWTAKCAYLKKLFPPSNYSQALRSMYDILLTPPRDWNATKHSQTMAATTTATGSKTSSTTKNWTFTYDPCMVPLQTNPNHLGLGRYALERWAFSHPDVIPCSVLPSDWVQSIWLTIETLTLVDKNGKKLDFTDKIGNETTTTTTTTTTLSSTMPLSTRTITMGAHGVDENEHGQASALTDVVMNITKPFAHTTRLETRTTVSNENFTSSTITTNLIQKWKPTLHQGPKGPPKALGMQFGAYKSSFARLAGRLLEWRVLYDKEPRPSSWIWKWYRSGGSSYYEGTKNFLKQCQGD